MKVNGKGIAVIITLFLSVLGYLGLTFYPATTRTISAENYLAGIIDSRPDDSAFIGWGNIQSRHNVLTAEPIQRVLVKRPPLDIPSGSTITKAILRIYTKDYNTQYCSDTAKRTYGAHKITQDWSPSSLTWRNQPSFASTPTATIQKSPKTDVNQWWEFDVTADINSPYGWTLKDETEDAYGFAAWTYIVFIDTAEIYLEYTLPSYTLTVSVKDSDGSPLQGASVTSPFTATTDASGTASSSLSYGSYTVAISYQGYTYTGQVTLDSDKTVSFTIPKYTLTVKVVDAQGNPLSDATISMPVYGTTNLQGVFSTKLPKGKYTVKANVGVKEATDTVDLTSDKTVTLTLGVEFTLQIVVKDQCGNPLPAVVSIDGQNVKCDSKGTALMAMSPGTRTVYASIQVGSRTFSANETFTLSKSMTKDIVITRRFYWVFYFNYTDGTVPSRGQITLTSPKETLTVPLTNGVGEAYLLDGVYRITVEASPAVEITTITVNKDGIVYATLNKEKARLETSTINEVSTTSGNSPVTTPEVPWVLIPSVYIYTLVGVLALGFIIAGVVALRRKR